MSATESQLPVTNGTGELPATSQSNAESFTTYDGVTDMTIRKRNAGTSDDAGTEPMNIDGDNGSATTSASSSTATSSTAYSFSGNALGNEKITTTTPLKTTNTETKTGDGNESEDKQQEDSFYECNICLDTAKDAVVSMCGHLFCWPCLHQWLETRPNRMLCPVCKAAISKDKVIPLYGRNSSKQEDPRNKVPPRPAGQRTEPEPQQGFQGFGFGDGFHMSFGIGAFPFAYFASSFNIEPRPAPANRGTNQYEDEQQLSKLFLYLAFLCIAWLMFA